MAIKHRCGSPGTSVKRDYYATLTATMSGVDERLGVVDVTSPRWREHIERGAVNALVSINAGEGVCLTAGITIQSAENLDLHPGQRATAIFKAGSVILGVLV